MANADFSFTTFADVERSQRAVQQLHEMFIESGSTYSIEQFGAALSSSLKDSPDPDLAVTNLVRFAEASLNAASLFNDFVHHEVVRDVLVKLLSYSRYFADILVRDPELFRWLTASDALVRARSREFLAEECTRILKMFQKSERRMDGLKRLYRREVLRIGARDILAEADLATLTAELSFLADAIVDATCAVAAQQLAEKFPHPPATHYAVIGLGKLGGEELNYSSDIDIMFVYGEEGELTDATGKTRTYHEYFNAFVEKLVQNLSQTTFEGHLYRVDTRLRPESGAGPLARSMQSFLIYYESRGELWERQMLIKARPIAGDKEFGSTFLRQLEPFVYPRSFMENPRDYISRIKARIEAAVAGEENVKLRAGGIRDIEFIVQALQLINGGKNKTIRCRSTLPAIDLLGSARLLSGEECATLRHAYVFFRTVEHRLQTMLNTQTHEMPKDPRELDVLARKVRLPDRKALQQANDEKLAAVRAIYKTIFASDLAAASLTIESVIEGNLGIDAVASILGGYGFRDTRRAAKNISVLISGTSLMGTRELDARAREAFRAIAHPLLTEMAATRRQDLALQNVAHIAAAHPLPEQLYRQLSEPHFRKLLLTICAVSPRLAKGVARHPLVLEMIAANPSSTVELDEAGSFITFKSRSELHAGIRYVLGFTELRMLTNELTTAAERVVRSVFRLACSEASLRNPALAVFALGKFGTSEITFDADVDLLFVAESRSAAMKHRLEKLGMAIVRHLSQISEEGKLYDVDARLRPEGRNAPLVVDRQAYLQYLAKRASLWERQSLTRLRFVAGNEALGKKVMDDVRAFVYDSPLPGGWVQTIVEMRRKTETRSRAGSADLLDFKLGAGGMVDVEFLAQIMQLKCGRDKPELRHADTATALLQTSPLFRLQREAEELVQAYEFYRRLETFLRITLEERNTLLPEEEKLDLLSSCVEGSQGATLHHHVARTMKRVRELFFTITQQLSES